MSAEKVTIGDAELWHGDCRDVLPGLEKADLVVTDPPYFRIKGHYWDNEWDNRDHFLSWLAVIVEAIAARMRPNGSLYLCASPQLAGRVETLIATRLNVLGHIVWRKGRNGLGSVGWHQKAEKEAMRAFAFTTERIVFAEHYGADSHALGESSYVAKCDELRGFIFEPLRAYLAGEVERAGWTPGKLNEAMGFAPRGMAETRYFGRSQWQLPTATHYRKMQALIGCGYLRREYEDLRREYEDLRRPFNVTPRDQWSDVWEFDPVAGYPGKHPCEKPLPLLAHMIRASSRPGGVVLDPFLGSGATGDAALALGRRFVGIERDREYFDIACERIAAAQAQGRMFSESPTEKPEQKGLLA